MERVHSRRGLPSSSQAMSYTLLSILALDITSASLAQSYANASLQDDSHASPYESGDPQRVRRFISLAPMAASGGFGGSAGGSTYNFHPSLTNDHPSILNSDSHHRPHSYRKVFTNGAAGYGSSQSDPTAPGAAYNDDYAAGMLRQLVKRADHAL